MDSATTEDSQILPYYTRHTLDMFLVSAGQDHSEISQFNRWREEVTDAEAYTFEVAHLGAQRPEVQVRRSSGRELDLTSFASYNYLGYSYHPEVIAAAKKALDTYGLGATGSPVLNGTFEIHNELETKLVDFFGLPDRGITLFSSGYGANVGVISAYIHKGDYVILDRRSHASLFDGAILSRGNIKMFKHNNMDHLEKVFQEIAPQKRRMLVCTEGVFSADGDVGQLADVVKLAKSYGASVLVDEAHSLLVTGPGGRGVAADQGVLDQVDMIIGTFSKSLGGVGGCLFASKELTNYINYYARSRMFSCAIDPAVTAGITRALELGAGKDGEEKRLRLHENGAYLRSLLEDKVDIGTSKSWIVPVIYGSERLTIPLSDFLQIGGLDISLMMFPAVPKNESRVRLFVTSEHTREQIEHCAKVIIQAAEKFGFAIRGSGAPV